MVELEQARYTTQTLKEQDSLCSVSEESNRISEASDRISEAFDRISVP